VSYATTPRDSRKSNLAQRAGDGCHLRCSGNPAIIQKRGDGRPSVSFGKRQVVDGLGDAVVLRHSGALVQQPGVQRLDHRSRSLPPHRKAGSRTQPTPDFAGGAVLQRMLDTTERSAG